MTCKKSGVVGQTPVLPQNSVLWWEQYCGRDRRLLPEETLEKISNWFNYQGRERIYNASPDFQKIRQVLKFYEHFLEKISKQDVRDTLKLLQKENCDNCTAYANSEKGVQLSEVLTDWLKEEYPVGHQIHHTPIFQQ